MVWFNFLEEQGLFLPQSNPGPIEVKDGIQIPYWESLNYLEKLSIQIKEGKELGYIDKIINIIVSVSENPKDNYRTWFVFIKILSNLPNDKVSTKVIDFIPVWLTSRLDTLVQTSELIENLLPKFLNDSPSDVDIIKAELILKHLFALQSTKNLQESEVNIDGEGYSYRSYVHLYFLKHSLIDKGLVPKIITSTSDKVIYFLADSLKKILLDYPGGIRREIKTNNSEFKVKVIIDDKDLNVFSKQDGETQFRISRIINYEEFDIDTLTNKLKDILVEQGLNDVQNEEIKSIVHRLFNDQISDFLIRPIDKMHDEVRHGDNLQDVFALILRDFLREKAIQYPASAASLFESIVGRYKLPFFKRLVLYAIAENWTDELKSVFFNMINKSDPEKYFSDHKYESEIYYLLKKNVAKLNSTELSILDSIIENGPQIVRDYSHEKYPDRWRFNLYAALKENSYFCDKYLALSNKLNLKSGDLEESSSRGISIAVEFESPISLDNLIKIPNDEIIKEIFEFNPVHRWDGPSIEGFAKLLGRAVEADPNKFVDEIEKYREVPYRYAYSLLDGLTEAWRKKKEFDWGRVLTFCMNYISSELFKTDILKRQNDDWGADHKLIIGKIGNLITEGTQSDGNAFAEEHLPLAKVLIAKIVTELKVNNDFEKTNMDYPMYAFNSTAGKCLRGLLDYSLRQARVYSVQQDKKWDADMKAIFIKSIDKGIVDAYIFQGMYYQQFFYLDSEWISTQFKKNYELDDKYWLAFMAGLLFANPPFNEGVYRLTEQHYRRAIATNKIGYKNHSDTGIARHLGTFYLRGYENLETDNIITQYLNKTNHSEVINLISFIRHQQQYIRDVDINEKIKYELLVTNLWRYILNQYKEAQDEGAHKILSNLPNFIEFIETLDEGKTKLIEQSIHFADRIYDTYIVVNALLNLKEKGDLILNAKYIGEILNAFNLNQYLSTSEKQLINLIDFVFIHGERELAIKFCNKLAMKGYEFQNPVFLKNK